MSLKNYKYVFILTLIHPGSGDNELEGAMPEPSLYADARSLPGTITSTTIRKAMLDIGNAVFSREAGAFLTYAPVRGK